MLEASLLQAGGLCRYSGYYSKPVTAALFRNVAFGSKATSEEGPLLGQRQISLPRGNPAVSRAQLRL